MNIAQLQKKANKNDVSGRYDSLRPLHSGTSDLTRTRTSSPVKSQVRLQLDIWCPPAPGLIRPGAFWEICHRFAFFDESRRHKVTESHENSTFVPSCLCGGTDLLQIYGGVKGFNPVLMLDRVRNGLSTQHGNVRSKLLMLVIASGWDAPFIADCGLQDSFCKPLLTAG